MIKRVNNNKFGVIEYAIDNEEDLRELPKEDTNNTVYAIMKKDEKKLVYLYSKELKEYILINRESAGFNAELENINEQLDNIVNSIGDDVLPTTSQTIKGAIAETFQSVSNGKILIASAITDKGVPTSNTDTFQIMADNIKIIENNTTNQQPIYETINDQLYRVILNEDFSKKNYLDKNIFADRYGINS